MNHECDHCDRRATHHSVEIVKGEKIEKHLCDACAAEEGLAVKPPHAPINELLSNFVKMHSQPASAAGNDVEDVPCERCGLTFEEFREESELGCPGCYEAFAEQLQPLLERAHGGGSHHIGKVPRRAGAGEQRQKQLMRLRRRLEEAVGDEDYERAAELRDEIADLEAGGS